jgi:hypothetical protein
VRILANKRHTVESNGGELFSLVRCFPNLETLSISWSILQRPEPLGCPLKLNLGPNDDLPHVRRLQILLHPIFGVDAHETSDETVYEVRSLMQHLPLTHIKEFGIHFETFLDSDTTNNENLLKGLSLACHAMPFEQLESFHLAFNFDVFELPALDVWVSSASGSLHLFLAKRRLRGILGVSGANDSMHT